MQFPSISEVQPEAPVQAADVGRAAVRLLAKVQASGLHQSVGEPGISEEELGSELIAAVRLATAVGGLPLPQPEFQATVLEQLEAMLQRQEVMSQRQEAMGQRLEAMGQQLGALAELSVGSSNTAARVHNRSAHWPDNDHLLIPLRKERQPGNPEAAAFGALPPAGQFPATHHQAMQLTGQQLAELGMFYEEDFGIGQVEECRQRFVQFICSVHYQ